jgi:hypothetical protein
MDPKEITIEQLLLHKSFDQLSTDEKNRVLSEMDEFTYRHLRETALEAGGIPLPSVAMEERLVNKFRQQYGWAGHHGRALKRIAVAAGLVGFFLGLLSMYLSKQNQVKYINLPQVVVLVDTVYQTIVQRDSVFVEATRQSAENNEIFGVKKEPFTKEVMALGNDSLTGRHLMIQASPLEGRQVGYTAREDSALMGMILSFY